MPCSVYDGDEAVAWCEYGSPEELPNIYHRAYEEELDLVPDYRITGIFVDGATGERGCPPSYCKVPST